MTSKLCGNGAHYGYNCPPKVPIIPNSEPFNNQTIKELPPTFLSFDSKSNLVHDYPNVFDPPSQLPFISCEFCGNDAQEEEKQIEEDQAANARYWKIPACYDDYDNGYAFAITPNKPNYSLSMGDEHPDTIPIDSLLDEFADELVLLKSIPPRINETDCDFEEEIRLIEKLLYDNSSPRPPEKFVFANSDAEIESFSPSPIPVKDSDTLIEEIDLSFTPDYPMPPGIEDDDYDSERDILISEDLPSNDTLSIPEKESFHFDIPSFSRPLAKPPDVQVWGNLVMLIDLKQALRGRHPMLITVQYFWKYEDSRQ
nr:hypothetical protein [Tanacetum cinerariifolium]